MVTYVYEVHFYKQKETVNDYLTEKIFLALYSTKEKAIKTALHLIELRNRNMKNKIVRISDYKYASIENNDNSYANCDYYINIRKLKVN